MKNKNSDLFFKNIRKDFPILDQKINGHQLIYSDNGATTQKPIKVIDSICDFYKNDNSNVHRGIHTLSERATDMYENVRIKVANFINSNKEEIVFTYGTTSSFNILAKGIEDQISEGDEIVLSQMEHHANIVCWQELAKKRGAILKFIPINKDFRLDLKEAEKIITQKTKIVAISHISNVLGTITPAKKICSIAHKYGAYFVLDCAQSIVHMKVDVKEIDCDFIAFSSHKMFGPTGVGVLYGKSNLLEKLKPSIFGGDMIYEVSFTCSTYNKSPYKFEAGTPNIEGVIGFGAAIDYLNEIGMDNIELREKELCEYFLGKVSEVKDLKIYGPNSCNDRSCIFSFNIDGIHSHDMSTLLDMKGIAIRGGHHCAMPLHTLLELPSTSRISLCFYNTFEEIDKIVLALKNAKKDYEKGEFLLK